MSDLKVGDKVEKIGGDYTFVGIIVSVFKKLSGKIRLVVEDDRGVLHVYSEMMVTKVLEKQTLDSTSESNIVVPGIN